MWVLAQQFQTFMNNPDTSLFTNELWQEITRLLDGLNSSQELYLYGYLGGKHQASPVASTPAATQSQANIAIAYGTETGNSKGLAEQLVKMSEQAGKPAQLVNLADIKLRNLKRYDQLFIICSTHGDGDPPEPVEQFHHALMQSADNLSHLSFAVLALGDSSYEQFCVTGKQFDQKLAELNATRLLPCVECDVDFQEPAATWMKQVLELIPSSELTTSHSTAVTAAPANKEVSKQNPVTVEVLENIRLSASQRDNAIHHIELAQSEESPIQFNPGDSIGVFPHNAPELVEQVLSLIAADGTESVELKEQTLPLLDALRERCDLSIASTSFLKKWLEISQSETLGNLLQQDTADVRSFLKNHSLVQILTQFPASVSAQDFVQILRPLQPRLYDVANSLKVSEDEIHLTVEHHRFALGDETLSGVASRYLAELGEGASVSIYPHHNNRFHLPEDKACPLVLLADGTGIAPYRAFLQELEADESRQHSVWLLFSEHSFTEDFLYQLDLQQALSHGELTRLDAFFAEDKPDQSFPEFVGEHSPTLEEWLKNNAHVYLSGHKPHLDDVIEHMQTVLESSWNEAVKQKRIHRNLY